MEVTKLTPKQKRFIAEYKKCGNATESAKKAGYKANSESAYQSIGCENLIKLERYIKEYESKIESSEIASVEEINKFWTAVMNDETNSMADRIKASELRMKSAGGFIDRSKIELSGNVPVTIVDDINED